MSLRAAPRPRHGVLAVAALILVGMSTAAPRALERAVEPYRETFPDGTWIDGLDGHLGTIGRLRLTDPVEPGTYPYRVARDRAIAEARRSLRQHVAGLRIDGGRLIGDDPDLVERVHRLVESLEPVGERIGRGRWFEVDLRLPLRGLSGVLGMMLDRGDPGEAPAGDGGDATGLIIDATGLGDPEIRPALSLLPRILDVEGRVVHAIDRVDRDMARELGLVAWARPAGEDAGPAPARGGERPIRVTAVATAGDHRADLVIGKEDADRILAEAARAPFLAHCRVVVLMPPPPPQPAAPAARPVPRPTPEDPNRLH